MNGFLVIAREQCYEVPLALFDDRRTAKEFAAEVNEDDVSAAILKIYGIEDHPTFLYSVGIVRFRDGEPDAYEPIVKLADPTLIEPDDFKCLSL